MNRILVLLFALFCHVKSGFALDKDAIFGLLGTSSAPVQSIDDFVAKLPEAYHKNYARIYHSRAEFPSDCENKEKSPVSVDFPRIVAFGADSKVILSYRGNPHHSESYKTLQFIEFQKTPKPHWDFYETTFPIKYGPKGNPLVERNPPSCTACHGNSPKPIVDGYFLWPGMVGSEDDKVSEAFGNKQTPEAAASAAFFARQNKPGRYASLHQGSMAPLEPTAFEGVYAEGGSVNNTLGNVPNTAFTAMLYHQYAQVLGSEIADAVRGTAYRYAALAALACYADPNKGLVALEEFLVREADGENERDKAREAGEKKAVSAEFEQEWKEFSERNLQQIDATLQRHQGALLCWFGSGEITNPRVKKLAKGGEFRSAFEWEKMNSNLENPARMIFEPLARLSFILKKAGIGALPFALDREHSDYASSGSGSFQPELLKELALRLLTDRADKALRESFEKARVLPFEFRLEFPLPDGTKAEGADRAAVQLAAQNKVCDELKKKSLVELNRPLIRPPSARTHGERGR